MHIFLSAELYGKAGGLFTPLCRECSAKLKLLEDRSYGDELVDIGIISIIMPEEFFEDGGYRERILFQRKQHGADVRLRIPYKSFIICKPEVRRQLYVEHIIHSIAVLKGRVSKHFEMDRLLSDVRSVLTSDGASIHNVQACAKAGMVQ